MRSLGIQMFEFSKLFVLSKVLFKSFGFSNVCLLKSLVFQMFEFSSFGLQKFDIAAPVMFAIKVTHAIMCSCFLFMNIWCWCWWKKNRTIEAVRTLLYICIHCGECSCIVVLFKYKNERIQMPHKSKNILRTYTFKQPKIQSFWAKF